MNEQAVSDFKKGLDCAVKATEYDRSGRRMEAAEQYRFASNHLVDAFEKGYPQEGLWDQVQEYINRYKNYARSVYNEETKPRILKLIRATLDLDAKTDADSLNGPLIKSHNNVSEQINTLLNSTFYQPVIPEKDKASLKNTLVQLTDRIRELKLEENRAFSVSQASTSITASNSKDVLTRDELNVLRSTSKINGQDFLPFLEEIDIKETWIFDRDFCDFAKLSLSDKQRSKFSRWVRPKEFMTNPKMIVQVSSETTKQTVVTDCSFIASIAISADYERRTGCKLITNIIYPQKNHVPVYNPSGKYMIKLHINGCPRKVIIDDFLPLDLHGELLCSYSSNPNELWVSFLEKAYMKVMGGYDFPGSSSNIDLHALTGWIPERIAIRPGTIHFNKMKVFRRVKDGFDLNQCLVTIATGTLSQEEADRAGLVPTHAYAMLDIKQIGETKLFKLKNPWSHLRWKGNFSAFDPRNWTKELQQALNYNVEKARQEDDGIFWIDYESICHFFDVICVNWDPRMFRYRTKMHHEWKVEEGPKKNLFSSYHNPQYKLTVKGKANDNIWVLLTRHITEKSDFAENSEFIGLAVYKDVSSRKIYYPYDPEPLLDTQRINSPHCLLKINASSNSDSDYILMVSQYEKKNTIRYTVSVYSDSQIATCERIKDPWRQPITKNGEWTIETAGGCPNHPDTYNRNPCFQFRIDNNSTDNQVLLELKSPKELSVGMEIVTVSANNDNAPNQFKRKTSGDYRRGYVMLELHGLPGGMFNVIPSTFQPGQIGKFILSFYCNNHMLVDQIRR
ncbi:calpain 7 [Cichlidogyrus casuarinus]|uniref:Calpain 7 n=1 Tax=Cichlidogyrus casuarinus TaxID=1844966 RepID=A0ABD2Q152_9PLAT